MPFANSAAPRPVAVDRFPIEHSMAAVVNRREFSYERRGARTVTGGVKLTPVPPFVEVGHAHRIEQHPHHTLCRSTVDTSLRVLAQKVAAVER